MGEHRYVLTDEDLKKLSPQLDVWEVDFIVDEYTGTKRLRKIRGQTFEKDYETSVRGVIYHFSGYAFKDNKTAYLEFKWTDKAQRLEIEFEGEVLPQFKGRKEVHGWSILEE